MSGFGLRDESRKLWKQFVAHEFIYLGEVLNRKHQILPFVSKEDFYRNFWFELHVLTNCSEGENAYTAAIELLLPDGQRRDWNFVEVNLEHARMQRQMSMFVDVAERIKSPEGVNL